MISASIVFGTFYVQPTYWKKQGLENLNDLSKKVLLFGCWGRPGPLGTLPPRPTQCPRQTQVPFAGRSQLCALGCLGKNKYDSACVQNQGDGFSLLLYTCTSFKVRTACITHLVWGLVVSSCDVSPGPLYAGLGLQEGLEPGTWLEPLGWTRDLDLGYIPILIPKWYWKEYSVTQALSRTWMIEHLACVPALRPGMRTCYGRGAHLFQPTIHPLKLLPNAYWFSSM